MSEHKIKFSGWQALLACVLIAGVLVVRFTSFDEQKYNRALVKKLESELRAEYLPGDVENLRLATETGQRSEVQSAAATVMTTKLNIQSVRTSFPLFEFSTSQKVIVKVIYSLEDKFGKRAEGTKYYLFRYGAIGDVWEYRYPSNAVFFYLNFI